MFRLLKLQKAQLGITPGKKVVRSSDWLKFLEGRAILRESHVAIERSESMLDDVFEREKNNGYHDGLENIKKDMVSEQMRFSRELGSHLEKVEKDVTELVCALIEKIIGDIPERERVVMMIKRAVFQLKARERIKVIVKPDHVEYVQRNVSQVHSSYTLPGVITVEPDSRLLGDQCVVEAGGLVVEISLKSHMEALRRSFHLPHVSPIERRDSSLVGNEDDDDEEVADNQADNYKDDDEDEDRVDDDEDNAQADIWR